MAYFPLFFELENKWILAVGAGKIGSRRIGTLLDFGAKIVAVSPESLFLEQMLRDNREKIQAAERDCLKTSLSEMFREMEQDSRKLLWLKGRYEEFRSFLYLSGEPPFFLVLTATGDQKTDRLAVSDAAKQGIFANMASDRSNSDFYFPGIARNGAVTAGITAGGTNHRLAGQASEAVRKLFQEKEQEWQSQSPAGKEGENK